MASAAMSKRLEGKTVVITGASSGIGRATAVEFARTAPKNLRLILTARRIDTLKEVKAEIEKEVGEGEIGEGGVAFRWNPSARSTGMPEPAVQRPSTARLKFRR